MTRRSQIEKSLAALHDLLGETTEAAAAVEALRDMAADSVHHAVDLNRDAGKSGLPIEVAEERAENAVSYCLDRVALAVEKALQAKYSAGLAAGETMAYEDEDDDCPRDGEAESALASVYGENE